jgi:hypothetical protein
VFNAFKFKLETKLKELLLSRSKREHIMSSSSGSPSGSSSDDEAEFVRRKKAPRPKAKKAAAQGAAAKRARYIDAVAQESDADDDDDDDAEERQERVNARLRKEEATRRARLEKQKSATDIAAELEARYKAGGYRIGGGDSDFEAEEVRGGEAFLLRGLCVCVGGGGGPRPLSGPCTAPSFPYTFPF